MEAFVYAILIVLPFATSGTVYYALKRQIPKSKQLVINTGAARHIDVRPGG